VFAEQGVFLAHNDSERYESRFATVTVSQSKAIMLQGMAGTTFGMWVSHGEGTTSFDSLANGSNHCLTFFTFPPISIVCMGKVRHFLIPKQMVATIV
jgi:phosphoribosylformylglycinamidine (FGAM) synthase-like amidotransferase family enzyme